VTTYAELVIAPSSPGASFGQSLADFQLPPELEAHEPPEARGRTRDSVRLLVSRTATGEISHRCFAELPELLLPGDLLVVNNSATLPAAVAIDGQMTVHFSTAMPEGDWLVELRSGHGAATVPFAGGQSGQRLLLPGGALLTLTGRFTRRLWRARLSTAVIPYLLRHGAPIRYSYVPTPWSIEAYQTVFATVPGSAEMPSAGRPFTPEIVTRLVSRGIVIAPITLHTGVSSLEGAEEPYPEPYDVPAATARLVRLARERGGRVIAVGTTVVRALETAGRAGDLTANSAGWTTHVVTPQTGVAVVDGLLTGLHEPRSTHLWMLAAFAGARPAFAGARPAFAGARPVLADHPRTAGEDLLSRCYRAAAERGYRWHEFGDVHLLLP
jgi:S-adenosylmethionine:tRNA-ribosyltransferase-isomerase (queuine synthetase)